MAVRPDLTNKDVERMAREEPGSAAQYLEERRAEIEEQTRAAREADDRRRWIAEFVAAGGSPQSAPAAYQAHRNERAAEAAKARDAAAVAAARQRVSRAL